MFYVIQTACPNICQWQTRNAENEVYTLTYKVRISETVKPACATNKCCKAKPNEPTASLASASASTAATATVSKRQEHIDGKSVEWK